MTVTVTIYREGLALSDICSQLLYEYISKSLMNPMHEDLKKKKEEQVLKGTNIMLLERIVSFYRYCS